MLARLSIIFAVVLTLGLGACSTTEEVSSTDEQLMTSGDRELITDSAGYDNSGYAASTLQSGPVPGTQEDLVVNIGDRVFFGYDRYDLSTEARSTLEEQARWLMQHQSLNITIEGHADERGTREYNLALGERRASSVENYLIALGVDPRRINTVSYG